MISSTTSFALGELLIKQAEARIRKIVVGESGEKIPTTPIITKIKPDARYRYFVNGEIDFTWTFCSDNTRYS